MFALSGLGGENYLSRVKRRRWNKKFEKHWVRHWPGKKQLHPNNKQKPEIQKNTGKIRCQYGQPGWAWKVLRSLCLDFHLHLQVLWLTPHWFHVAAWKFCLKKRFSRRVLANTARFLRITSLETVRFLAPEGITNFGTALAKQCNHVFCSFVL